MELIRTISKDEQEVDLSNAQLHLLTGTQLKEAMFSLHAPILTLDLSCNSLNQMAHEDLLLFFKSISGVQHVNLSGNDFNTKSGEALFELFSALLPPLKTLDLSNNGFTFQQKIAIEICLAHLDAVIFSDELSDEHTPRR
ncbi:MAG: hypothetical protein WC785_03795 [Tatlockia sp.]|jgi:hypothetical protein